MAAIAFDLTIASFSGPEREGRKILPAYPENPSLAHFLSFAAPNRSIKPLYLFVTQDMPLVDGEEESVRFHLLVAGKGHRNEDVMGNVLPAVRESANASGAGVVEVVSDIVSTGSFDSSELVIMPGLVRASFVDIYLFPTVLSAKGIIADLTSRIRSANGRIQPDAITQPLNGPIVTPVY